MLAKLYILSDQTVKRFVGKFRMPASRLRAFHLSNPEILIPINIIDGVERVHFAFGFKLIAFVDIFHIQIANITRLFEQFARMHTLDRFFFNDFSLLLFLELCLFCLIKNETAFTHTFRRRNRLLFRIRQSVNRLQRVTLALGREALQTGTRAFDIIVF